MTEAVLEAPTQEIEVIAQLTQAELQEVRSVQAEMTRLSTQMRLEQAGSQEMWRKLYVKYQLPPDTQLDYRNGALFRYVAAPTNGEVHAEPPAAAPVEEPILSRQQRRRARRKQT